VTTHSINKKCVGCYKRDHARRLIQGLDLEVCHGCGKDIDFALGFLAVQLGITDEILGLRIMAELGVELTE